MPPAGYPAPQHLQSVRVSDFQDGYCSVRPIGVESGDSINVPLPKSVFRAVLARIAALCNERNPDSVTPYRGEGEFSIRTDPFTAFHVAFTNSPDEQRLEVKSSTRPGWRIDFA